jgi:hypothetical protein
MTARFSRWILALLAALVAVGMSFGSASAAPTSKPATPNPTHTALTRAYRLEQARLRIQDVRLTNAGKHADRIDQLIARLQSNGKDTAALEQAVAAFRAGIAQARTEWQAASATLTTHAGFDDTGKVTDADQARATLKDAHDHMAQAHTLGHAAYQQLHAAMVAYRKTHRGVTEPVAPLQP